MSHVSSLELIFITSGIALIWIGTLFYIFPFMFWLIPSIILGFVSITTGYILIAFRTIFIVRKRKGSRALFSMGIMAAVFIILWGTLYILAIFRP